MARLASVAEYSFTGMETMPNEMVMEAIDRAAMLHLMKSITCKDTLFCFRAFKGLLEALLAGECVSPAVPGAAKEVGRVGQPEIKRMRLGELVPGERHGDRRAHGAAG